MCELGQTARNQAANFFLLNDDFGIPTRGRKPLWQSTMIDYSLAGDSTGETRQSFLYISRVAQIAWT
jgi:hypothetical protein